MTAPAGPIRQYLMDNTGVLHPGGSPSTTPSLAQGAEGQESSQNKEPHGKWKRGSWKYKGDREEHFCEAVGALAQRQRGSA